MIIDAHATDTVPSHEVRQRALEALANAGEPMSEVTYDALRKRIAKLEAALRHLDDLIVDLDMGRMELYQVSDFINAALTGGEDE